MVKNLIFVCRFTIDNYVYVEFDPLGFSVKDIKTSTLLQRCNSIGELYHVLPSTTANAFDDVSLPTWHRRLGHHGSSILNFYSLVILFLVL